MSVPTDGNEGPVHGDYFYANIRCFLNVTDDFLNLQVTFYSGREIDIAGVHSDCLPCLPGSVTVFFPSPHQLRIPCATHHRSKMPDSTPLMIFKVLF